MEHLTYAIARQLINFLDDWLTFCVSKGENSLNDEAGIKSNRELGPLRVSNLVES